MSPQLSSDDAGHSCSSHHRHSLGSTRSNVLSIAAEQMLASSKWKTVSWRSGTKGRLNARFAALRVRTADGPPQRIWVKPVDVRVDHIEIFRAPGDRLQQNGAGGIRIGTSARGHTA
jgi:hypothetical protein